MWVGRGFGDELLNKDGQLQVTGWELGCSDVKDQIESLKVGSKQDLDQPAPGRNTGSDHTDPLAADSPVESGPKKDLTTNRLIDSENDGTDDHLHRPMPDSNPVKATKPGEPATHDASSDKQGSPTHADIESLQESADIAGKIVMLSRGGCGFLEKAKWAQRRGALALVVGDNERGAALTIMYAKGDTSNITIPAIFTSYMSAQILSSLTPPEDGELTHIAQDSGKLGPRKPNSKDGAPVFTSLTGAIQQPTIGPSHDGRSTIGQEHRWAQHVLAAIGFGDEDGKQLHQSEDSRRPPSSGNIDWVLADDWDEQDSKQKAVKTKSGLTMKTAATTSAPTKSTTPLSHKVDGDEFVIGVHDWRDTDLVAPKPAETGQPGEEGGSPDHELSGTSIKSLKTAATGELKGGSITPGSGEYVNQRPDEMIKKEKKQLKHNGDKSSMHDSQTRFRWVRFWRSGASHEQSGNPASKQHKLEPQPHSSQSPFPNNGVDSDLYGLWVTLTPTSVSTSPFFDTLLVLVVSPLVTLTVVYALLLLRSRVRRRRWRAPKSVVERLPVRTYHRTSTSSSTTSSQIPSRTNSPPTSPLLPSVPQDIQARTRLRSQTTTGVVGAIGAGNSHDSSLAPQQASMPAEKLRKLTERRRYTGCQVECVVCLEEYVDGESRVMSLPCGHEFHADCITPWLVNRRRTCPICKGDVVRSLAKGSSRNDQEDREDREETSDDVQDRAAVTRNDSLSAAIPVPSPTRVESDDDMLEDDVERGDEDLARQERSEQQQQPEIGWRGLISSSVTRLSGETVWRNTPNDRSR